MFWLSFHTSFANKKQIFVLRGGFGKRGKLDIGERKWEVGGAQLRGEEGLDPGFEGKPAVKFVCLSIWFGFQFETMEETMFWVKNEKAVADRKGWGKIWVLADHLDVLTRTPAYFCIFHYLGIGAWRGCQMSMSTVVRVSYVDHETLLIRGHYYWLIGGPLVCFRNMQTLTQQCARLLCS